MFIFPNREIDEPAVLLQFPSLILVNGASSYFFILNIFFSILLNITTCIIGTESQQNDENDPLLKAKKKDKKI